MMEAERRRERKEAVRGPETGNRRWSRDTQRLGLLDVDDLLDLLAVPHVGARVGHRVDVDDAGAHRQLWVSAHKVEENGLIRISRETQAERVRTRRENRSGVDV